MHIRNDLYYTNFLIDKGNRDMIIGAYGEQIEKRDFLKPILEKIKCYVDFRGHIQVNITFWGFFSFQSESLE